MPLTLTYLGSNVTGGRGGAAKAYLESALAGLNAVAGGGRFVANSGLGEAVKATRGPTDGRTGFAISAAFTASYQAINSGSKIEGESYNALSALIWRFDNQFGVTRLGVLVEVGWGAHATNNGFASRSVKGGSDSSYAGVGLFPRL